MLSLNPKSESLHSYIAHNLMLRISHISRGVGRKGARYPVIQGLYALSCRGLAAMILRYVPELRGIGLSLPVTHTF